MRRTLVLTAITIGSIILVALVAIVLTSTPSSIAEPFQTRQQPTIVTAPFLDRSIYGSSGAGIQACKILRKSFDPVSDNFVDTFRLRKWAPQSQNQQSGTYMQGIKDKKQFCYFFTNSNDIVDERTGERLAPVLDPISSVAACDKSSSLFAGTPFIDKAFIDTSLDASHTLPYSKCVLQIDPTKINSASLSNFWTQMNDSSSSSAFCKGYLATVSKEISRVAAAIDALHRALLPYRVKYASLDALQKRIQMLTAQTLALSGTQNLRLADQLSELQKSISQSNLLYGGSNTLLESKVVNLDGLLRTRVSERDEQAMRRDLLIQDWNVLKARSAELARTDTACANALQDVLQETKNVDDENNALSKQYTDIETRFYTCRRELQQLEERYTDALVNNDKLAAASQNIVRMSRECSDALQKLQIDEEVVNNSLVTANTQLNTCQTEVAKTLVAVRGLEQSIAALYDEIADVKKRCRNQQVIVENKLLDADQSTAQMLIRTQQQVCAAAISVRKRRTELLAEISSINDSVTQSKGAAESCDRKMQVCGCYSRVGAFAWNDHGREGGYAKTTTGRIDELRGMIKFIKQGNRDATVKLRWRQNNGLLTGMHTFIRDDREAGSTSKTWVLVAGDVSQYSTFTELHVYYRLPNDWRPPE